MAREIRVRLTLGAVELGDASGLINAIEERLLAATAFTGHELGGGGCSFYVEGGRRAVEALVNQIARDMALGAGRLVVEAPARSQARKRRRPKPYDVWAVPLSKGKVGYAQCLSVDADDQNGDLIRVFSLTTETIAPLDAVLVSPMKFGPVLTVLSVAAGTFGWKWIGNAPVEFEQPVFRQSLLAVRGPGVYEDWILWSRGATVRWVGRLDEEQRKLEFLTTWSPCSIAERIVTGRNEYEEYR